MLAALNPRLIAGAAILALLMVTHVYTYRQGKDAAQDAHRRAVEAFEKRLAEVSAASDRKAEELIRLERERDTLKEELLNEARNDPDADETALNPDSVRRIFRRGR